MAADTSTESVTSDAIVTTNIFLPNMHTRKLRLRNTEVTLS
jgi:hypothetical protein